MKNKTVEVIADNPEEHQVSINELIGKQFPVRNVLEDGSVQVNAEPFEGIIILNPGEFKFV